MPPVFCPLFIVELPGWPAREALPPVCNERGRRTTPGWNYAGDIGM